MRIRRRRKYFIDKDVQGALAVRVVGYYALCLWGIFCVLAGFPLLVSWWFPFPETLTPIQVVAETWSDFWPSILASLLLLPFVVQDVIRMSNRFVGPVYRLRNAMRDLADGKPVPPVRFRKGDFWFDFAEEFNRVAALIAPQIDPTQDDSTVDEPTQDEPSSESRAEEVLSA